MTRNEAIDIAIIAVATSPLFSKEEVREVTIHLSDIQIDLEENGLLESKN